MSVKLCDMHSHILPGIDDGAKDEKETMQALKTAAAQGIQAVLATPHYYPGRYETDGQTIRRLCRETAQRCMEEKMPMSIYSGHECFYHSELTEKLDRGEVLTLAESRYVLVEFAAESSWRQLQQGLTQLQYGGYHPVLAHFERYACLEQEERLDELKSRGIWLQMNYDTLLQKTGWFRKSRWQKLLQEGYVDLLGSDCHGTHFRPYQIQECLDWMEKKVSKEMRRKVLVENVQEILSICVK